VSVSLWELVMKDNKMLEEYDFSNGIRGKYSWATNSKEKELEKWEKGITLALNDKEYISLTKELSNNTAGN